MTFTARVFLLVGVAALVACGRTPDAPSEPLPRIEIEAVAPDLWRATWRLEDPVSELVFLRPAGFVRERYWRVLTPGFELARVDGAQVVRATADGRPTDTVVVEFPVWTLKQRREYEPFVRFSDGSVAVHTGILHAVPRGGDRRPVRTVTARAPDRQHVVAAGRSGVQLTWTDDDDRGTYAYVGTVEPVAHERLTMLVDPGVPEWLTRSAERHIPAFIDVLTERTAVRLDTMPVAMLYHTPGAFEGYASGGGMLTDFLQLGVSGDDWHTPSAFGERHFLRFVAHEAVHLWNGGLARFADGAPAWLHEGSADALAERLLVAAGLAGDDDRARWLEDAFNGCITALDDAPMNRTRVDPVNYHCGNLVAEWTERLLAPLGSDLFRFWGALVERARTDGGRYDLDDYMAVLRESGVDDAAIGVLGAFVASPHPDPVDAWRGVLEPLGIMLERDDAEAPEAALFFAAKGVLMALLDADCNGTHGYFDYGDVVELAGLADCGRAAEGMRVDGLAGHRFGDPGFAAAAAAHRQCRRSGTVEVSRVDAAPLELSCPSALPPVRGYWRLASDNSSV